MMRLIGFTVAVFGCAAAAGAQGPPARPRPAPAAQGAPAQGTSAGLDVSLYGAYGDPQYLAADGRDFRETEAGADGAFSFAASPGRIDLFASAGTNLRHLPSPGQGSLWSHIGSGGFTAPLWDRASLTLRGSSGYSHFVPLDGASGVQGGDAIAHQQETVDFGLQSQPMRSYGGGAELVQQLTTRSSLLAVYNVQDVRSVEGPDTRTLDNQLQLGFFNQFRQRAAFRLAYSFREAEYGHLAAPMQVIHQHSAMVGLDREWIHSRTRQSTLRISGAPSVAFVSGRTHYLAAADISLDSQVARGWVVSTGASRGLTLLAGVARPYLTTSLRARLEAQLSRRLTAALLAVGTEGDGQFDLATGSYRSLGGTMSLRCELSPAVSLFGEYVYTHYEAAGVFPGGGLVPRQYDRGRVRIGLRWQQPLVKGGPPANAAR